MHYYALFEHKLNIVMPSLNCVVNLRVGGRCSIWKTKCNQGGDSNGVHSNGDYSSLLPTVVDSLIEMMSKYQNISISNHLDMRTVHSISFLAHIASNVRGYTDCESQHTKMNYTNSLSY